MANKLPAGTVLKLGSNIRKRYLKIPNEQFNEFSHGDTAIVLTCETDGYTEIIYRFKIENLKLANKIEQERLKQIKIEQERLKLIKAEKERIKQIKDKQERIKQIKDEQEIINLQKNQQFKKAFELESQIREITCEFCDKLLTNKMIMFVNVEQNPVHYFCQKSCKLQWIYQKQEK